MYSITLLYKSLIDGSIKEGVTMNVSSKPSKEEKRNILRSTMAYNLKIEKS